ncbi:O-antigen ligase family protein [Haloarchaeobius salinus]|uniref:O-antigen ligase family protein n=1 Tax=Haloarchaeobius salinus TaxID=1198298 RepID=UPI0021098A06|nr:hypothetical protein [Haloarchaeobius salinus]
MLIVSSIAVIATLTGTASAFGATTVGEDRYFTVQFLLVVLLVAAVSFSPRIPLDFGLLGSRRLDIRIEDLLLVIVLLSLVFDRAAVHSRIRLTRFFTALFAYLAVAGLTTVVGITLLELPLFRGVFYFLKEVEFILIAVAVSNIIRTRRQLYVLTVVFVGCALVNAGWAGYQLLMDSTGPLFQTIKQSGYYGRPVGASGTALIGEPSRLSSGGYYLAPLFLACGWLLVGRERSRSLWWGIGGLCIGIAMVASLSRASIFSAVVALVCLTLVVDRLPTYWLVTIPVTGFVALVAVSPFVPVARFRPSYVLQSIFTRFEKWDPIIASLDSTSFLGAGKGSLIPVAGVEEAHNFFLRVFVEAGAVGVLLFVLSLLMIARAGYTLYRGSKDPVVSAVGLAAVCATVSVSTAALFQDAFINVKLAESYWLLIGALGAAVQISE